jgi:hypothetical protein
MHELVAHLGKASEDQERVRLSPERRASLKELIDSAIS